MAMYEYFCDYAGIVNHQSHMEMREKEKNSERVRAAKGRTHWIKCKTTRITTQTIAMMDKNMQKKTEREGERKGQHIYSLEAHRKIKIELK